MFSWVWNTLQYHICGSRKFPQGLNGSETLQNWYFALNMEAQTCHLCFQQDTFALQASFGII